MYQFSKIAKNILIYSLIFTFLFSSFFGSTIIRTTKAQGSIMTVPGAPGPALKVCNDSIPKNLNVAIPMTVSLSATPTRVNDTQIKVDFKISYNVVTPQPTFIKSAVINEARPVSNSWQLGATEQTTKTVTVTKGDSASFRATADICWEDAGGSQFHATTNSNNIVIDNDATGTKPPTTTSKDTGGQKSPLPNAPAEDSCLGQCPGGTWWWKVDKNIQNAICNMQCTIIDWESSMIGWVVSKVLYPALGLCIEGGSPACPTPPGSSAADPSAPTPTP